MIDRRWLTAALVSVLALPVFPLHAQAARVRAPRATAATRPNIVLMFPDNLGWGEVGAYGSVRGVPTPNIDSIAAQGMRLDNFNVEFSCTVSRAALLTGRYAIRSGAAQPTGITLWEMTLAEALKSVGLRHRTLRKVALGRRQLGDGIARRSIRDSTSGTAFRTPATKRSGRRRRRSPKPTDSRSSGSSRPAARRAK